MKSGMLQMWTGFLRTRSNRTELDRIATSLIIITPVRQSNQFFDCIKIVLVERFYNLITYVCYVGCLWFLLSFKIRRCNEKVYGDRVNPWYVFYQQRYLYLLIFRSKNVCVSSSLLLYIITVNIDNNLNPTNIVNIVLFLPKINFIKKKKVDKNRL